MTDGGSEPPARDHRARPVLDWRARLEALQRSVMRVTPVARVLDVMRAYEHSGGGMLAGALAYFAFFTTVPALLLFVGLLGVLIEDTALREQLIEGLVDQVDPISDLARFIVTELADTGRLGTVVGVVGLLWGASGFYAALQGAMLRVFPGPGGRDAVRTRLRGVVTVIFILGTMLAAVVVVFALPMLTEWLEGRCAMLRDLDRPWVDALCGIDFAGISNAAAVVGAMGVAFLAALVVYVAIPTDGPTIRQAFWPALAAGVVIGLLTSLFGWIAPLLVRHWLTLGIVGSVFVALVWFNLVFQALVYGAAFARLRRDRDRLRAGKPRC